MRATLALVSLTLVLTACGSRAAPPQEGAPPSDSAVAPAEVSPVDAGDTIPAPAAGEPIDPAVLDARDAEDYARREQSMESEASCLLKARQVPDPATRSRLEEVCHRRGQP
jgi:hypothetical protein